MIYVLGYVCVMVFSYAIFGNTYFNASLGAIFPIIFNMVVQEADRWMGEEAVEEKVSNFINVKVKNNAYFVTIVILGLMLISNISKETDFNRVIIISLMTTIIYTLIYDARFKDDIKRIYYKKTRKKYRLKIGNVVYMGERIRGNKIKEKAELAIVRTECLIYMLSATIASVYTMYDIRWFRIIVLIVLGIETQKRIKIESKKSKKIGKNVRRTT